MKNILFLTVFSIVTLFACNKNEEQSIKNSNCDEKLIIDKTLFESIKDSVVVNSFKLDGNCLKMNYSDSGCDGKSWEIKLVDAGEIMESYPAQRRMKLSLKNEELCDAFITKETSFDISQIINDDPTVLIIENGNTTVEVFNCNYKCSLDPKTGLCKAAIPKYYFDKKEGKCKMFSWGGCKGVVPFDTLEECQECGCK